MGQTPFRKCGGRPMGSGAVPRAMRGVTSMRGAMSSVARDYKIVLAGLRDGSSRARHAFAATLARVPGWSEEHAHALLAQAPVVVHRTGDADEARRTCAFLVQAGGDARID